jgi:glycine dehydrogenase subunit 1
MPFIPHTDADVSAMLETIGVKSIDELFSEIPKDLRFEGELALPPALNEMSVSRLMTQRAAKDAYDLSFIGAGAYEHYMPAAVGQLISRGEYYTGYTPYQAEASQGNLQVIFEYQTMMTRLTGLDASNASVYGGATALTEAVFMAVRANKHSKSKRVLIAGNTHPHYIEVVKTIVKGQGLAIDILPFSSESGLISDLPESLGDYAACVIAQPNFFGGLEAVDTLTDWAHSHKMLTIALVNPLSLAILKPPGSWGEKGADIACGDGQSLGLPLSSGGPYFGFLCCRENLLRQLPGRIVGRTTDLDGKVGFTLTLQAREQHIRRGKAKSNMCTNQGLMVTAATIHMSLMGPEGLKQAALKSHANIEALKARIDSSEGVELLFQTPVFHECVIRVNKLQAVLERAEKENVFLGLPLSTYFPDMSDCLLVNTTETKTDDDLDRFAKLIGSH